MWILIRNIIIALTLIGLIGSTAYVVKTSEKKSEKLWAIVCVIAGLALAGLIIWGL